MKTSVLIAVDTSGEYNNEHTKSRVLYILRNLCPRSNVDLITFDADGILQWDIPVFLENNIVGYETKSDFMSILEYMDETDYDRQFILVENFDGLQDTIDVYSLKTHGFVA